jgi:hypothetical protein
METLIFAMTAKDPRDLSLSQSASSQPVSRTLR